MMGICWISGGGVFHRVGVAVEKARFLGPTRWQHLREGTWNVPTLSDLVGRQIPSERGSPTNNLAPCHVEHLELHLERNWESLQLVQQQVLYGQMEGCPTLHAPLHSGPVVPTGWSSRAAPCRTCCNSPTGK